MNAHRRHYRIGFLLPALFTFISIAQAAEPPRLTGHWVNPFGKTVKLGWSITSEWIWKPSGKESPSEQPALRIWILTPLNITIEKIQGTGFETVVDPPAPAGSPEKEGKTIAFDVAEPKIFQATFQFKDGESKSQTISLVVQFIPREPALLVHERCTEAGIEAITEPSKAVYFFSALDCEYKGDDLTLHVFYSNDAAWKGADFKAKSQERDAGWNRFDISESDLSSLPKSVLGHFKVASKSNARITRTVVSRSFLSHEPQKIRLNGGLSSTYLNYAEGPFNIKLTEWALTGKTSLFVPLISDLFDTELSIFGTLLPLTHSPSELEAARFIGVNFRIGYQTPLGVRTLTLHILGGWYYWGMIVPENAYGVKFLSGPQIFTMIRNSPRFGRGFTVYTKFAPIATSVSSASFANRELAIGSSIELSNPQASRKISATLDIAHTYFALETEGNSMSLLSVSLGISIGIF